MSSFIENELRTEDLSRPDVVAAAESECDPPTAYEPGQCHGGSVGRVLSRPDRYRSLVKPIKPRICLQLVATPCWPDRQGLRQSSGEAVVDEVTHTSRRPASAAYLVDLQPKFQFYKHTFVFVSKDDFICLCVYVRIKQY